MTYQRRKRARRVQLAVPGSNDKMMRKASESTSDHVFLDLEDAVAPAKKKGARAQIVTALKAFDWTGKTRCVRINDLRTRWAYEDIIEVVRGAGTHLDTIMIPKVQDVRDVHFVETLLEQLELDLGLPHPIGIEALIEDVHGMKNVERIAECSPRLECLIFGMGDYSASQKMDPRCIAGPTGYPGDVWQYGRYKLLIAARCNGLDPVDGPITDFRNEAFYVEEARRALILGFTGKWAIHPAQVPWALQVFAPRPEEVAKARRLMAAYREAEAQGLGAIQVDGEVVDAASMRILQNILDRADLGAAS